MSCWENFKTSWIISSLHKVSKGRHVDYVGQFFHVVFFFVEKRNFIVMLLLLVNHWDMCECNIFFSYFSVPLIHLPIQSIFLLKWRLMSIDKCLSPPIYNMLWLSANDITSQSCQQQQHSFVFQWQTVTNFWNAITKVWKHIRVIFVNLINILFWEIVREKFIFNLSFDMRHTLTHSQLVFIY